MTLLVYPKLVIALDPQVQELLDLGREPLCDLRVRHITSAEATVRRLIVKSPQNARVG